MSDDVTVFREDAEDAVRIVSGMLRRGEAGEAFRERRRAISWSATEAGLQSPSIVEERGTAVRVSRGKESLLVACDGDGPEALREAVRATSRRAGAPFKAKPAPERGDPGPSGPDEENRAGQLASALARALPDPRGLSLALAIGRVTVSRAGVTARGFVPCGEATRLEATGVLRRPGASRSFAFQTSAPFPAACGALARALAEAARPVPAHRAPEGRVDVVLSPEAASVFWHEAVGHPLEAEGGERTSVLTRVARASVAPPGTFVTSDPTRRELPGSYLADDEGTPARAVPLLEDGRVAGVLTDRRTAGAESNGHGRCGDFRRPPRPRLSALVVSAGRATRADLFDACGNGLYVREISAGTRIESGRFALRRERRPPGAAGPARPRAVRPHADASSRRCNLWGESGVSAPASGLGLCVKRGEPLPVGGLARDLLRGFPRSRGGDERLRRPLREILAASAKGNDGGRRGLRAPRHVRELVEDERALHASVSSERGFAVRLFRAGRTSFAASAAGGAATLPAEARLLLARARTRRGARPAPRLGAAAAVPLAAPTRPDEIAARGLLVAFRRALAAASDGTVLLGEAALLLGARTERVATTAGRDVSFASASATLVASVSARTGAGRMSARVVAAAARPEELALARLAHHAVDRVLLPLKGRPLDPGRWDLLVDPLVAAAVVARLAPAFFGEDEDGFLAARTPDGTEGAATGLAEAKFQDHAEAAKKGCLVSRALAGVANITLKATLVEDTA